MVITPYERLEKILFLDFIIRANFTQDCEGFFGGVL